jgi:5-methylcytosine-specific restriction endonuclease McrA
VTESRHYKYNYAAYNDDLHRFIRMKVGKCLHCGVAEVISNTGHKYQSNLTIHHIDGNKGHNTDDNITVLCRSCHNSYAHLIIRTPDNSRILTTILTGYNFTSIKDIGLSLEVSA